MARGQWVNLTRMPGLHPYSFQIFNDHRKSGLTSHPKDGASSECTLLFKSFGSVLLLVK